MKVPKDAKREREGHSHVAVVGKQWTMLSLARRSGQRGT